MLLLAPTSACGSSGPALPYSNPAMVRPAFGPGAQEESQRTTEALLAELEMAVRNWRTLQVRELFDVLAKSEADALPACVQGLQHWRPGARLLATEHLTKLGAEAAPAAPFMISSWRYDVADRRAPGSDTFWELESCAEALAGIGSESLPWLEWALDDDLAVVRARACRNLGPMGETAERAVPRLLELLEDDEDWVRDEAARAVLRLTPSDSEAASDARGVLDRLR